MSKEQREKEKVKRQIDNIIYALIVGYILRYGDPACVVEVPENSDLDESRITTTLEVYRTLREDKRFYEVLEGGQQFLAATK